MTTITIFGKPMYYESYDFFFGREQLLPAENSHPEPAVRPLTLGDTLIHYFVRGNQACLECYSYAKAYKSDKVGVMLGVAFKSDVNFSIPDVLKAISTFWGDFANALLDDKLRFKYQSIVASLKATKWSQNEINKIAELSIGDSIVTPYKDSLLLVASEESSISLVENRIKEYSDVYIANNIEVLKANFKGNLLQQTNKQIYTIENGELLLKHNEVADRQINQPIHAFSWGNPHADNATEHDDEPITPEVRGAKPDSSGNQSDPSGTGGPTRNIIIAVTAVVALMILGWVVWKKDSSAASSEKDGTIDTIDTEQLDSLSGSSIVEVEESPTVVLNAYDQPIQNNIDLKPEVSPNYYTVADIVYDVTPADIAKVEESKLIVVSKPSEDTSIEVIARINGVIAGTQTYTIKAKSKEVVDDRKQSPPEPMFAGRKISAYIRDLKDYQNKGGHQWVVKQCNVILADPQYKPWHNQVEHIKNISIKKSKFKKPLFKSEL